MNVLLAKNRPEDVDAKEWQKVWDNAGYSLRALHKTIVELSKNCSTVREDDFSIPNHYALMAYQAGKKRAYQEIMDMLPNSAKD